MKTTSRLRIRYEKEIVPTLTKEFGIKNRMDAPKITKIVINSGVGEAVKNKEILQKVKADLATITGQLPSLKSARVSVASFGLRKGMPIGVKVTLRGNKM